jgi:transposase-like protein
MVNKYIKRSRISEDKFRDIVRLYALDLPSDKIAILTHLNRNTVNRIVMLIRIRIAEECEAASPFQGEVEVDESYFGARRVRGIPGRGADHKTPVFGIYDRGGKVYTEIVPNCSKRILQKIIRGHVELDTIIHSDMWKAYDGLVDIGYKKHFRVRHSGREFARGKTHINGIESFWSYANRRLAKFHGIPKHTFYLHLKECEFRFNNRTVDHACSVAQNVQRETA